ncbi:conserved hypothetical protein [Perkinsus marinus ATCC 50983]|uniref:Fe2OG dioxygenase domain-containing protein n=1 Tax=Perkinsus marinus (strain ATCC 50983 / TXsc) TaxID=423536 RepID=C5L044_PERM5|nr:conserved hypothetical protein [Perkinsus marinus ATCC 50983]EER09902.1 conserved hypothetical protein [Perkinsus marinus ATCC 50983]|eukprot:XP_002778107.1 conserved hypothetical protein [Perkinsus marinus ATCC 50983]
MLQSPTESSTDGDPGERRRRRFRDEFTSSTDADDDIDSNLNGALPDWALEGAVRRSSRIREAREGSVVSDKSAGVETSTRRKRGRPKKNSAKTPSKKAQGRRGANSGDRWPLDHEGSWLTYLPKFVENPADALEEMINEVPWEQGRVKIFGKEHLERRLTAFYADDGQQYRYSGGPLRVPSPWRRGPIVIDRLRKAVGEACGQEFNCCVLNYYRDGSDSIGLHSDDEKVLGVNPSIACVSLGAERDFVLDAKRDKKKVQLTPRSGSLLVMGGSTQKLWKHSVPSRKREHRPRVSLTFRYAFWKSN